MATNVLIPTPTPFSPTDAELLNLLQQAQNHQITNNQAFFFLLANMVPVPMAWKLQIYHFFLSLPIPPLSAQTLTVIFAVGPFIAIGLFFTLILFLPRFIKSLISFVLSLLPHTTEEKVILELLFPADTSKSAYATEQLYTLLHSLALQKSLGSSLRKEKNEFSLEIVSTKDMGIRYLLVVAKPFKETVIRGLRSYLPGIEVSETKDYVPDFDKKKASRFVGIEDLSLSNHFALPLETQKALKEHDPISFLTGNMTKLADDEVISFQIVATPLLKGTHDRYLHSMTVLRHKMVKGEPLSPELQKGTIENILSLPVISLLWFVVKIAWTIVWGLFNFFMEALVMMGSDGKGKVMPVMLSEPQTKPQEILNPYEQELSTTVKNKIDQKLFETSIRLMVISPEKEEVTLRLNGLLSTFGQLSSSFQSLIVNGGILSPRAKTLLKSFTLRSISKDNPFHASPILSVSELTDLFHFPYAKTTKTEGMHKLHSVELPLPLSIKNTRQFDVVFGKNSYAGTEGDIGLTDDDRSRHVYIIGQTGSGKTTVMYHMAKDDIQKGRGVAVVDPHGDLAEDLLATVPKERINDCMYVNPFDIKYPVGINLLELSLTKDEDELDQEKELVCESVISIFRRVFSKEENTDAHRIEYILRNAIYTAFTIPDCTIFTVYELLNNPKFQKSITKNLSDENLKNFWKNEFGRAGNYQVVKMVAGVTAKVGRFLFSPTAKRILEQPKSTINFDEVLDKQKILICNVSEGKLGEDTSALLGTMVIAKIHQAATRRIRKNLKDRTPFYLFIDEFQNFATPSFSRLLSGGRKFGLRLTIAEQSTAQQDDRNLVNVVLANTGTVICFRTASPIDEELMLSQFAPYVEKGNIGNLPRFRFYMKLSAINPEEPFSGHTLPITTERDELTIQTLIEASRKNYAQEYQKQRVKSIESVKSKTNSKHKKEEKSSDISTLG